MLVLALLLAVQQQQADTFVTAPDGRPPSTAHQIANYRIVARLDEQAQHLSARGVLTYVNASRDTLREMYVHQYLNAFRPGSKWSAVDEREGRVRFQKLKDPDYGYERFTAPVTVNGVPVRVDYPGAPDSTVAHFMLPTPIAPGDTALIRFEWEARASTVYRRQGHRGRSWDFSQWYPKVAVYDNGGWEPYPLRPAGEFYGEFGTFDVTLVLRDDQVVAGTGLVVSGDPGWERVKRFGDVYHPSLAPYTIAAGAEPWVDSIVPGSGEKAVRFHGEHIHEFAWTTSPDYRYEGGVYLRPSGEVAAPDGVATWDTVALNVLYRPADTTSWGNGVALSRMRVAMEWLEHVYGPYAYPMFANVHRLDGGGTEFPMMMMNGSASQGLILHEGGHIFTFGILANNEWRSGWMDEGLTSYQTSWAEGVTPQDRARRNGRDSSNVVITGYRRHQPRNSGTDITQMSQYRLEMLGRAQPVATRSDLFSEFGIYNDMIYTRAELMYGALRDALGDSAFTAFMHRYYAEWPLQHVDERAMRGSAERASGQQLGWFFDQWLHHTGLTDYALLKVEEQRQPDGSWLTRGRVVRRAEYREPPPLGVRTSTGWTIARGTASADDQWIEVHTAEKPAEVKLDPLRTTEDWDRRDDVAPTWNPAQAWRQRPVRTRFMWPFLDQVSRDKTILALRPTLWAASGGLVVGIHARSNYQGLVDRDDSGIALDTRNWPAYYSTTRGSTYERLEAWDVHENPTIPWRGRPLIGLRTALWTFDGAAGAELSYSRDVSRYFYSLGTKTTRGFGVSYTAPRGLGFLPARWERARIAEAKLDQTTTFQRVSGRPELALSLSGGYAYDRPSASSAPAAGYARGELSAKIGAAFGRDTAAFLSLRGFGGFATDRTPVQRRIFLSSRDPYQTLYNNYFRPKRGLLSGNDEAAVPLGGPGLRAFDFRLSAGKAVGAMNVEQGVRVHSLATGRNPLALWLSAFADGAVLSPFAGSATPSQLGDAGLGLMLRGWIFDRDVRVRVDAPFWVSRADLAADATGPLGLRGSYDLRDVRPNRIQLTIGSFW